MIVIKDKKRCCGCYACANVCPKSCISMKRDEEGFSYPEVDVSRCVNCGVCERVCPVLNPFAPLPDAELDALPAHALRINDDSVFMDSSSGGVFSAFAMHVISKGGVVFGAAWAPDWTVRHAFAETEGSLAKFRGSKYLQSEIGDCYKVAKKFLSGGRLVLFSGTPCQIAGLKRYIGREPENLITIDIACAGVPSPEVWESCLADMTGGKIFGLKGVKFRKKLDVGGRLDSRVFSLEFEDGEVRYMPYSEVPYLNLFGRNLVMRPSCHACAFKWLRSGSDIILGDFWGIEKFVETANAVEGVSLAVAKTPKGHALLDGLMPEFTGIYTAKFGEVVELSAGICKTAPEHPERDLFFKSFAGAKTQAGKIGAVRKFARLSLKEVIAKHAAAFLKKLGLFEAVKKMLRRK